MSLRIITAPTAEPVVLGEVMEHGNIGLDERHNDAWFTRNIKQARELAEEILQVPLTDALYEYRCERFGCEMVLPVGGVREIEEITYIDTDGAEQTLAADQYVLDDNPRAPVIHRAYGVSWPSTRCQANAVTVQFRGLYSETDSPPRSPPEAIRGALCMMVAAWFEDREGGSGIPLGAMMLLSPHRFGMGV